MRAIRFLTVSFVVVGLAAPVAAQSGRAVGTVRDVSGKAIKSATVRAINTEASPPEFTSATDDKGRWAMIGLRSGTWKFIVEAPGFLTVEANAPVRVAAAPPLVFTLARDPGPVPNALDRNIQQLLLDAATLRDQGRLDQAITAYQDIRTKNPKLTSVSLVMADVYRKKAAQEKDPTARRALLGLAVDAYNEVLKSDAMHERARVELESTRKEAAQ
jgi:hypothetical protein